MLGLEWQTPWEQPCTTTTPVVCLNHQELQYGLFLLFWDCFCFEQLGCQPVCKNRAAWNNHACIEIVLSSLMVFRSLINVSLTFVSTVKSRNLRTEVLYFRTLADNFIPGNK
jgi:hypothetical protein